MVIRTLRCRLGLLLNSHGTWIINQSHREEKSTMQRRDSHQTALSEEGLKVAQRKSHLFIAQPSPYSVLVSTVRCSPLLQVFLQLSGQQKPSKNKCWWQHFTLGEGDVGCASVLRKQSLGEVQARSTPSRGKPYLLTTPGDNPFPGFQCANACLSSIFCNWADISIDFVGAEIAWLSHSPEVTWSPCDPVRIGAEAF